MSATYAIKKVEIDTNHVTSDSRGESQKATDTEASGTQTSNSSNNSSSNNTVTRLTTMTATTATSPPASTAASLSGTTVWQKKKRKRNNRKNKRGAEQAEGDEPDAASVTGKSDDMNVNNGNNPTETTTTTTMKTTMVRKDKLTSTTTNNTNNHSGDDNGHGNSSYDPKSNPYSMENYARNRELQQKVENGLVATGRTTQAPSPPGAAAGVAAEHLHDIQAMTAAAMLQAAQSPLMQAIQQVRLTPLFPSPQITQHMLNLQQQSTTGTGTGTGATTSISTSAGSYAEHARLPPAAAAFAIYPAHAAHQHHHQQQPQQHHATVHTHPHHAHMPRLNKELPPPFIVTDQGISIPLHALPPSHHQHQQHHPPHPHQQHQQQQQPPSQQQQQHLHPQISQIPHHGQQHQHLHLQHLQHQHAHAQHHGHHPHPHHVQHHAHAHQHHAPPRQHAHVAHLQQQQQQEDGGSPMQCPHGNLSAEALINIKIRKRNVCYVVGLPIHVANEEKLRSPTWFAQYGNIATIAINRNQKSVQANSIPAHITYDNDGSALNAISFCNQYIFDDGRKLKATFGTQHYCRWFIAANKKCTNVFCGFRHSWCRSDDIITNKDINDFKAIPAGAYTSRNIENQPLGVRNPTPNPATAAGGAGGTDGGGGGGVGAHSQHSSTPSTSYHSHVTSAAQRENGGGGGGQPGAGGAGAAQSQHSSVYASPFTDEEAKHLRINAGANEIASNSAFTATPTLTTVTTGALSGLSTAAASTLGEAALQPASAHLLGGLTPGTLIAVNAAVNSSLLSNGAHHPHAHGHAHGHAHPPPVHTIMDAVNFSNSAMIAANQQQQQQHQSGGSSSGGSSGGGGDRKPTDPYTFYLANATATPTGPSPLTCATAPPAMPNIYASRDVVMKQIMGRSQAQQTEIERLRLQIKAYAETESKNKAEIHRWYKECVAAQTQEKTLRAKHDKLGGAFETLQSKYDALQIKYLALDDKYKRLLLNARSNGESKKFGSWSATEVVHWIVSADEAKYAKYKQTLTHNMRTENIDGACLESLDKGDLHRLGVTDFKDKKELLMRIKELVTPSPAHATAVAAQEQEQ